MEKAGWAHGRPAAAPSAWEQPRALSLREFPSLAAAASVPQQQQQQQQQHPLPQPDQHGAWDEDERGRGLPTGPGRPSRPAFRGRSQDARFDPAFGGGDDGEFHGPPPPHAAGPHYGRHHGEFSPSPQHRRFEEEPPYGRYGRPPPPGPGPYWRDEPPPRDWHRHDRFDGPPQRYGPPRRDFGGRYGRGGPSIDEEPEHPHDRCVCWVGGQQAEGRRRCSSWMAVTSAAHTTHIAAWAGSDRLHQVARAASRARQDLLAGLLASARSSAAQPGSAC